MSVVGAAGVARALQAHADKGWAVLILARMQSERVGAFVPSPAGMVQAPCRYTRESALQALNVRDLNEAMATPHLASQINAIVQRHL